MIEELLYFGWTLTLKAKVCPNIRSNGAAISFGLSSPSSYTKLNKS